MKLNTSPLIWDIDSSGQTAPTVTPAATATTLTLNLSNLEGRVEDLWAKIQAIWVRLTFTLTQASGSVCNRDKLYRAVSSFRVYSPVLGDLIAERSGQGAAIGLIDQVLGAGYKFPVPMPNQVAAANGDYTIDVYYRIPLALDFLAHPQDTGIWAPFLEKGKIDITMNTTAADLFQTGASIKASAATVRAWFEVLPEGQPVIHAPCKFVKYEFNTSGTQLKLFSFGNGDGLLGINPGARLSTMFWLSSLIGLGGVDTVEKWTRLATQWRRQKVTVNPEALMAAFLASMRTRVAPQGSYGSTIDDSAGWPYSMAGDIDNSVLDSEALFFPIVWPGYESKLSGFQKQVGDLQIDAGFSSNPNGTHVFRTLEHYSWKPDMIAKLMNLMGFSTKTHTAEPKTADNTDPRHINPKQLWGVPLRIVPRSQARLPVL